MSVFMSLDKSLSFNWFGEIFNIALFVLKLGGGRKIEEKNQPLYQSFGNFYYDYNLREWKGVCPFIRSSVCSSVCPWTISMIKGKLNFFLHIPIQTTWFWWIASKILSNIITDEPFRQVIELNNKCVNSSTQKYILNNSTISSKYKFIHSLTPL